MRKILPQVVLFIFPWPIRRFLLCKFFGYRIQPTARIGISIVLTKKLYMAHGSRIGNLTLVKGLDSLELGNHGRLGNLNWVSGFPNDRNSLHFSYQPERTPILRIGEHAAITHRHLLDCTGGITIGDFSTLAGFRSQILTHSINLKESRQHASPVTVGNYCFVGTGSILLGGSTLPSFCVLGAGSLLNKSYATEFTLYAGNPARPLKLLDKNANYFTREHGFVH